MELINLYLPDNVSLAGAFVLIVINLLCAFISTALSLGGGLLMLVSLSFFVPPIALVPVHGIIQLGSNFARIFVSLKDLDIKIILPFMGGTLIGSYFGANIVDILSPAIGQIGVGLFIMYSLFGKFPKLGKKYIFFGGVASSTMSVIFGASGPLVATLIKNMNFNPLKHVATHGSMMTFQHLFKSFAYFFIGFSFQQYLPLVTVMILVGFLGTYLGKLVLISKGQSYFKKILSIILFLGAIRLIYFGFQSL
ncbi:MAG: sulfite exporter TauE/SafE family protein [alpha proteobacterium HIMB114]|nr:MAG: sulfite exporter TauE/SafE family protein [alpha proteobacterium HIMB114]